MRRTAHFFIIPFLLFVACGQSNSLPEEAEAILRDKFRSLNIENGRFRDIKITQIESAKGETSPRERDKKGIDEIRCILVHFDGAWDRPDEGRTEAKSGHTMPILMSRQSDLWNFYWTDFAWGVTERSWNKSACPIEYLNTN